MEYRYRVFLAVANNLSFSKGAEELSISQPAVTTHVRELEKNLGFTLFDRSGNQIFLTKAGEIVYEYASKSLNLHTELIAKLNLLKYEAEGSLAIGAEEIAATYILPHFIGSFSRQFPQVELKIISGSSKNLEGMVKSNEIDVAIIKDKTRLKDLEYIQFKTDSIIGVAATENKNITNGKVSLSKIQNMTLIREDDASQITEIISEELEKNGILLKNFPKQIQLKHTEAVKNLVIHSEGFALLPKSSVEKELKLNQLKAFTIEHLDIEHTYVCVHKKDKKSRKADLFVQFITSKP